MYFVEVKCILLNVYGLAQFHNRFRKDMILSDFSGIPDSVWICLNGSGRVRGAATLPNRSGGWEDIQLVGGVRRAYPCHARMDSSEHVSVSL